MFCFSINGVRYRITARGRRELKKYLLAALVAAGFGAAQSIGNALTRGL